jgi:hypothetical protein
MTKKLCLLFIFSFILLSLPAQQKLPVIKATSKKADIRDGKVFKKANWTILPEVKPDIYSASGKKVTFYTDQDSISFKVKPNHEYNFIILLNGKDSAYTQIKYAPEDNGPDYLAILKKARQYNLNDNRPITKFTYESEQSPDLISLKNKFRLDSIAGSGDEISKIFNLMHWVHNSFKYDGSKNLPPHNSISELMTKCYQTNNTMHCGGMASVLNECYLAIGLKSRRVVCLPQDSTDFDCHSINTVYSTTLGKWLWIDPTFNAYVMNEKGNLLSIAEVRDRLTDNKPLILNADANVNRNYSKTKNDYLYYYMAKNLYAFECYVEGGGESESNQLLPVEYKGIIPRSKVNKPKCTNNPVLFWAKPE